MYSRNNSERRISEDNSSFLPPRYSGVRFNKKSRSDGRTYDFSDASFIKEEHNVSDEPLAQAVEGSEVVEKKEQPPREESFLSGLLQRIEKDDLLIIGLILIIAGDGGEENKDILLILVLLLCCR